MVGVVSLKDMILRTTICESSWLRRLDTRAGDLLPAYRTVENSNVLMNTKVSDVVKVMTANNTGATVVTDKPLEKGGKLVGMFSERTYLRAVLGQRKDPSKTDVSEVMEGGRRHMVHVDTPLFDCMKVLAESGLHYLPVYEDHPQWRHEQNIVGLMALRDLIETKEDGDDGGLKTWFE